MNANPLGMQPLCYLVFVFILSSCIGLSCTSSDGDMDRTPISVGDENGPNEKTADWTEPLQEVVVLTEKEEEMLIDRQMRASPFFELVCCASPKSRTEDCCCEEVVQSYEVMLAQAEQDILLKVKTEDPIFSACMKVKKWRERMEALEARSNEDRFEF